MKRFLKKFFGWTLAILVLAALAAGGLYLYRPDLVCRWLPFLPEKDRKGAETDAKNKESDRIWTVRNGDMTIGVLLKGTINAKVNHKLAMTAPFSSKLVRVVDENTFVHAGDVVAEFETADLLLKIEDYRMTVEQTRKSLDIAREERSMLVSSNAADLRTARDAVTAAEDEYKRYVQLEGPRERDNKNLSVSDAEQNLSTADSDLSTASTDYSTTVFATEEDEKAAKNKVSSASQKRDAAETKLNAAQLDRKLFKRYTYPNKLRDLRNKLAQAKLSYSKVVVRTQSQLAQKDNEINSLMISLRKNEQQLERHQSWVPMMKLIAPADGLVTYGDPDAPPWRKPEVKVGMDGRRNQVIITIPDMSEVIVNASLPEIYRARVSKGNPAFITPDASGGRTRYPGTLESIASLPENLDRWDDTSPKIYRTVFSLSRQDPSLLSGMNVQVEIVSRTLKDVLSIPIEAVFEENGELFVYRKTSGAPEKCFITIGESGDSAVRILSGLDEGDQIYLYRPFESSDNTAGKK